MAKIIGYSIIPEFRAFDPVKEYLDHVFPDEDIILGSFAAAPLGIELKNKLVYNMEYLHDSSPLWDKGYFTTLKNNKVLDFSRSNVEYLKNLGIVAEYLPYGMLKEKCTHPRTEKPIDVLFIGSTHFERREKILKDLKSKCNLVVAKGIYGKDLEKLIDSSKVHLNMHHAEGQPLETVRINQLLSRNSNIVSEKGSDRELNTLYENSLTFSPYCSIVESCLHALNTYDKDKIIKINPYLFKRTRLGENVCQQ